MYIEKDEISWENERTWEEKTEILRLYFNEYLLA